MMTNYQLDHQEIKFHNKLFERNAFDGVICKMVAILFRLKCVSLAKNQELKKSQDLLFL